MSDERAAPASSTAEIARRRTFAIISHPDAGKTTLTEKLLLYAGAVREAGAVAGKAGTKHVTSDWMSMERSRGISVSSAAMRIDYQGHVLNLLDTPGHQDFSEDTYRTLTAADSAVMLLDAARGVQEQTEKLFAVARRRGLPVFTFVNKLDRPALDPVALLDEIESTLGLSASPVTWPIGDGPDFRGVYERPTRQVHLFERTARNARPAPVSTSGVDDPKLADLIGERAHAQLQEHIAFVDEVLPPLDPAEVLDGTISPVFFGSVLTNFGVEPFLRRFLELAPPPGGVDVVGGRLEPTDDDFAAFVFKLQANMDRNHRDRTAFVRIVSGRFERGMHVVHARSGRQLKLARAHALFGKERVTVEEAWPGDVLGLIVPGAFRIGDVLSSRPNVELVRFPRFAPESFATVRPRSADRRKAFRKGLEQLGDEGVVQVFHPAQGARDPILGAVGPLQFDVFRHRMLEEYGVETDMDVEPHRMVRWLSHEPVPAPRAAKLAVDADGAPVALFRGEHDVRWFAEDHPDVEVRALPGGHEVVRL
ncbi:MAG: peptide chain release factor 3 [Trueperaceae bacterium]|nr:peptide chain release factor 3 [Trueperaceae bacterium]